MLPGFLFDLVPGDVDGGEVSLLQPDGLPGHHQPRPGQVETEGSPGTAGSGEAVPGCGERDLLSPDLAAEGEVVSVQAESLQVQRHLPPHCQSGLVGSLRDTVLLLLLLTETREVEIREENLDIFISQLSPNSPGSLVLVLLLTADIGPDESPGVNVTVVVHHVAGGGETEELPGAGGVHQVTVDLDNSPLPLPHLHLQVVLPVCGGGGVPQSSLHFITVLAAA